MSDIRFLANCIIVAFFFIVACMGALAFWASYIN